MLCKDCETYKTYGFSPVCKYCKSDGKCPRCGLKLDMGKDLKGPVWVCPNGHCFDVYGREFWDEIFSS